MKAHGQVLYEAPRPGHTVYTSLQSMYEYLSRDFIEPRSRFAEAFRFGDEDPQTYRRSERDALVEGIFERVMDVLRARDRRWTRSGSR